MKRRTPLGYVSLGLAGLCVVIIMACGPGDNRVLGLAALGVAAGVSSWALLVARRDRVRYEEQLRRVAAQESARAERLAIASDLHDIVSHGLAMITLQASTAPLLGDETDLRRVFADIETTSRDATVELRRLLSLLREDEATTAVHQTSTVPELLARARAAGLEVDAATDAKIVHPDVERAVVGIVEEGLANAARHAGRTRVHVAIRRRAAAVEVTIRDDGPEVGWRPLLGSGTGLRTLEARCHRLGGRLEVDAGASGFAIVATLPDPVKVPA